MFWVLKDAADMPKAPANPSKENLVDTVKKSKCGGRIPKVGKSVSIR